MYKCFFPTTVIFFLIMTGIITAQNSNSLQINGGIIMPMSSSKGLSATGQFHYSLNQTFTLYFYSGYAAWDKFNVIIRNRKEIKSNNDKEYFKEFLEDEHTLIPIYAGFKVNFQTNKLFTSFIDLEIGYTFLEYNSYELTAIVNPETEEVVGYSQNAEGIKNEHLLGVGIGAGISHPMTENVNLVLAFKLNSYINSNYYGLFSTRGTYTMFQAGFNFII